MNKGILHLQLGIIKIFLALVCQHGDIVILNLEMGNIMSYPFSGSIDLTSKSTRPTKLTPTQF